jgi:hypothetical protein
MQIALRPAHAGDFDYCAALYFAEMERIIRELNLDRTAQAASLRQRWDFIQVRIRHAGRHRHRLVAENDTRRCAVSRAALR